MVDVFGSFAQYLPGAVSIYILLGKIIIREVGQESSTLLACRETVEQEQQERATDTRQRGEVMT